ncbi:hypothetical protein CLF_108031 [Clonorchis sinensis]|uniref:Uncharacterized protein n=1 Tax=Clonorchis sinensis TaxID=79923 RepID=G7YR79_CLOSI|nr:hypothetical protein CLF_108031 [Clonorchis sinensis]
MDDGENHESFASLFEEQQPHRGARSEEPHKTLSGLVVEPNLADTLIHRVHGRGEELLVDGRLSRLRIGERLMDWGLAVGSGISASFFYRNPRIPKAVTMKKVRATGLPRKVVRGRRPANGVGSLQMSDENKYTGPVQCHETRFHLASESEFPLRVPTDPRNDLLAQNLASWNSTNQAHIPDKHPWTMFRTRIKKYDELSGKNGNREISLDFNASLEDPKQMTTSSRIPVDQLSSKNEDENSTSTNGTSPFIGLRVAMVTGDI